MQFSFVVCVLRLWWISIDSSHHIPFKGIASYSYHPPVLFSCSLDTDKHGNKRKAAHVRCGWRLFKSLWMESNFHQSALTSVTSSRQITVHQIRPKTQHKHSTHRFRPSFFIRSSSCWVFFNVTIRDIFCIDIEISTELWLDLDEIHQLFIRKAYYIQRFASPPSRLSLD